MFGTKIDDQNLVTIVSAGMIGNPSVQSGRLVPVLVIDCARHPSLEALQSGFFENFDSFQGHHGQYYTGGLFNFDMVQDAMEHARHIIETNF